MGWFNSVSIRYKILSIVFISVFGFAVGLVYNYQVTSKNNVRLNNVSDVYYPTLEKNSVEYRAVR